MVTRSRRRGNRPRHTVTVGEPETEAYFRAEPIVRIQSPPAKSLRTIGSRARDKLIDEATKPRNRSPISARYYKFESISLQRRVQ